MMMMIMTMKMRTMIIIMFSTALTALQKLDMFDQFTAMQLLSFTPRSNSYLLIPSPRTFISYFYSGFLTKIN